MPNKPIRLTRRQLEAFLGRDYEAIRQFERLFRDVDEFDESVQDIVADLIQNGTGLTWVYDDAANTLTGTVSLDPFDTDNLSEGSTNLYYTDERVDDRVAGLIQDGTGISWSYNDTANTLTGTVDLSPFSTDDLSEGSTNLYYTDARVDARIAASGVGDEIFSVDFDYTSSSPLTLYNASSGNIIYEITIFIETIFDDATTTISAGTAADNEALLAEAEVLPGVQGGYSYKINYRVTTAETFSLFLNAGTSTQGAGHVTITLS